MAPALWGFAADAAVRGAQRPERIAGYDVTLTLRGDGSMHVVERISYDFGSARRHGIVRWVPLSGRFDGTHDRVYPVSNVTAASPSGAPADLEVTDGAQLNLRIGNPDRTVTGNQTYLIGYDLGGVVDTREDRQELDWNVIGSQWTVPIAAASVEIRATATATRAACFQGRQSSTTPCGQAVAGTVSRFRGGPLAPSEGMTVIAEFPAGTFPDARPVLRERWTFGSAFALTRATVGGFLGLLAVLGGGFALLVLRRGRDEHHLGMEPGRGLNPVRFEPPEGVRPGEVAVLIGRRADTRAVTATIVDLAVREFVRIEELPGQPADWRLVKVQVAPVQDLLPFERTLYEHLFVGGRGEVLLSELRRNFRYQLHEVQVRLRRDVAERGWFRGNVVGTRAAWTAGAIGLLVAGVLVTVSLAVFTHAAMLGLAVILGGIPGLVLASRIPGRTTAGSATLAQVRGLRSYLEAVEAAQLRTDAGVDVFGQYLSYAIVFGLESRWTGVFAQLATAGPAQQWPAWYEGSALGPQGYDYNQLGWALTSFTAATSSAIAAPAASSSGSSGSGGGGGGDFGGGGGGGGGGSSW